MSASLILLVVAVICWFLAAIPWPTSPVQLGWLGLFFYGLSLLIRYGKNDGAANGWWGEKDAAPSGLI